MPNPWKEDIAKNHSGKENPILTSPSQGWREIWVGMCLTRLFLSPLAQDTPPQGMPQAARNAGGVGDSLPSLMTLFLQMGLARTWHVAV